MFVILRNFIVIFEDTFQLFLDYFVVCFSLNILALIFFFFFFFLSIIVPVLIGVAYFTLYERKLMGHIQRRKGPNVVGIWGILQPIGDGVKLLLKEIIVPTASNSVLFLFAPVLSLFLSFLMWATLPLSADFVLIELNLTVLFFFIISSFGVYAVVISGWASNSIYAFLGGIRSTAQMISYEVCLGFVLVILLLYSGSPNISDIILAQKTVWFCYLLTPVMFIFLVCMFAETNRAPFDLPEAEAEIVAGYNVEYSSMVFAMFFLAEYSNILLMCGFFVAFFLGGWFSPFSFNFCLIFSGLFWFVLKILICVTLFILVRAALPRYRYDMLMSLGWKVFLPYTFSFIFFYSSLLFSFGSFPIIDDILYCGQFFLHILYN